MVGKLPKGSRVALSDCTRKARWCRIDSADYPDGWVRGGYLVGEAAKNRVTPFEFLVNPDFGFDHFPGRRDRDDD